MVLGFKRVPVATAGLHQRGKSAVVNRAPSTLLPKSKPKPSLPRRFAVTRSARFNVFCQMGAPARCVWEKPGQLRASAAAMRKES